MVIHDRIREPIACWLAVAKDGSEYTADNWYLLGPLAHTEVQEMQDQLVAAGHAVSLFCHVDEAQTFLTAKKAKDHSYFRGLGEVAKDFSAFLAFADHLDSDDLL